MDTYLLKAAVLYALSATSHTSTALENIPHKSSSLGADLDPLTYELFDIRTPLERLADSELVIPRQLQQPILTVVRVCGDSLARIDDLVDGCQDDSQAASSSWKIQELNDSVRICRRTLQLALEVVNLASVEDDGADAHEILPTYLDQDTSRVLGLIRRTLQQFQEGDQDDEVKKPLKESLDQIRLYVQSRCRSRDDTRPSSPAQVFRAEAPAAGGRIIPPDHAEVRSQTSCESNETKPPDPDLPRDRHGPGNKIASVIARWSLGSPRRSNILAPSSARDSISRPSSALSAARAQDDLISIASSTVQTSRHTSQVSRSSASSAVSSSRGSKLMPVPPTSSPYAYASPPIPPKRSIRRSTLASMDEGAGSSVMPSPPTPAEAFGPRLPAAFDQISTTESVASRYSRRAASDTITPLLLFAISPPDKIVIDPSEFPTVFGHRRNVEPMIEITRATLLTLKEKGESHAATVYFVDMSPASYILASKHGDKTIRVHGLPQCNLQSSLKVNFYIKMRERSRDFFVTSHAILSETRCLIAISTGFGDTLEIWNWALRKKLQVIESVYRWAGARTDIYETAFTPLACYKETEDSIFLFPVAQPSPQDSVSAVSSQKKPPFGSPAVIRLRSAGLLHIPKLPELAYSSTGSLLVAAAGPRPPRAGHPPPDHAAMLMIWKLQDSNPAPIHNSKPWRVSTPTRHPELATALPCGLASHGSLVVSVWIPHNVRVIGRPGAWQVEPVDVPRRHVLVWDYAVDTTTLFAIPNENTIACISPDCRLVAYRRGPGPQETVDAGAGGRDVGLVVLDALDAGRELWRAPAVGGGRAGGLGRDGEQLMDVSRITCISFSADSSQFIVGDTSGAVGVYNVGSVK